MHFHPGCPVKDCRCHRPGSAAEINDNHRLRLIRQERQGFRHQQPGAPSRNEDAGGNQDLQPREFRPPQDVLQGDTFHPAPDIDGELRGTGCFSQQEARLVFGKDTTGGPQCSDNPVEHG
jgi:hypothetical protein